LPLAFVVARHAVAKTRRGDGADWSLSLGGRRSVALGRRGRERLSSPGRAQAWYEWRRHGRTLPLLIAFVLPFELLLLPLARGSAALVFDLLVGVAVTPVFLAAFVGATVGKPNPGASNGLE